MKFWLPALASLALTAPLAAQSAIARSLPADSEASIRIFNLTGSTTIIGCDRDSVRVTGRLPAGGGRFYMGGSRSGMKLGIESPADQLDSVPVPLEIRVPRRARVWVKSASANVTVSGVRGELDLSTVGGRIQVSGAPRVITAETMDGALSIDADAPVVRLKSADGAIVVTAGGGDLTVASVTGAITIRSTRPLLSGRVESVTGRVTFQGAVRTDGALDVQTHEAPITLQFPADQDATVDIVAFSGKVVSGFPGAARSAPKGQPVHYTLGAGGARITARSLKGGVTVNRLE